MNGRRLFSVPARSAAIAPFLWMLLFFLLPFGFVLKISLSHTAIAQPPYLPVFDPAEGMAAPRRPSRHCRSENFRLLASDHLYVLSYLRSVVVALISTVDPARGRLSRRLRHVATTGALATDRDDAW